MARHDPGSLRAVPRDSDSPEGCPCEIFGRALTLAQRLDIILGGDTVTRPCPPSNRYPLTIRSAVTKGRKSLPGFASLFDNSHAPLKLERGCVFGPSGHGAGPCYAAASLKPPRKQCSLSRVRWRPISNRIGTNTMGRY